MVYRKGPLYINANKYNTHALSGTNTDANVPKGTRLNKKYQTEIRSQQHHMEGSYNYVPCKSKQDANYAKECKQ